MGGERYLLQSKLLLDVAARFKTSLSGVQDVYSCLRGLTLVVRPSFSVVKWEYNCISVNHGVSEYEVSVRLTHGIPRILRAFP